MILTQRRLSSMNSGRLCSRRPNKRGYGSHYAARLDKSLPMRLATAVKRHVGNFGGQFPRNIVLEHVIAIFGRPMRRLFQKHSMKQLGKKRVRQRMLSAGIIPSAND